MEFYDILSKQNKKGDKMKIIREVTIKTNGTIKTFQPSPLFAGRTNKQWQNLAMELAGFELETQRVSEALQSLYEQLNEDAPVLPREEILKCIAELENVPVCNRYKTYVVYSVDCEHDKDFGFFEAGNSEEAFEECIKKHFKDKILWIAFENMLYL